MPKSTRFRSETALEATKPPKPSIFVGQAVAAQWRMEETRGADRRSDGNHQRSNAGAAELEEETICRRGVGRNGGIKAERTTPELSSKAIGAEWKSTKPSQSRCQYVEVAVVMSKSLSLRRSRCHYAKIAALTPKSLSLRQSRRHIY